MCGIFAAFNPKSSVVDLVFKSLKDLEYRGYDSWGMGIYVRRKLTVIKEVGELPPKPPFSSNLSANLAFGHTRWATHGQVTQANAHPQLSFHGQVAVVHNGIVENFAVLKQSLKDQGYRFQSATDTEVIADLIESKLASSSFLNASRQTAQQLQGLNSFLAFSPPTGELVAFKFGSPLVVGRLGDLFLLSSDTPALLKLTPDIYPLDDGQGVYLSARDRSPAFVTLNSSRLFKPQFSHIDQKIDQRSKGDFPHYLIKEIYDIPQVIRRLAELPTSQFKPLIRLFRSTANHYLVAAGTAHHANLVGSYYLADSQMSAFPYLASEFSHFSNLLKPQDLVLASSQSGETIDTLEAVKQAKSRGLKTAALVNVPASSLTRLVDFTFYLQAGRERAVLSTKAYSAKLTVFYLLASLFENKFGQAKAHLKRLAVSLADFFKPDYRSLVKTLALKLASAKDLYLLGRGLNYPTALEGALKIKEASYLHAEGFAAGELKHGVIALIESGTPVLVVGGQDSSQADLLSNALEVKARGAYLVGLAPSSQADFDFYLPSLKTSDPLLSPLANIIPLQLLAYELTLIKGYNPDRPRNLAKSVTVK